MYFTDISYMVHPGGRATPNGITLLGTAFFTVEDYWLTIQKNKVKKS